MPEPTSVIYRTSARTLEVQRFTADSPIVYQQYQAANLPGYPFMMNVYGYRMQSLYPASWLAQAGLQSGETIGSLQFLVGWSVYTTVPNFRLAIGWTSDQSAGFAFWPVSVVFGPVDITTDRLREGMLLTLPCSNSTVCSWNGVSNLIVELSYNNVISG
jgi:hypothetical protein